MAQFVLQIVKLLGGKGEGEEEDKNFQIEISFQVTTQEHRVLILIFFF